METKADLLNEQFGATEVLVRALTKGSPTCDFCVFALVVDGHRWTVTCKAVGMLGPVQLDTGDKNELI